MEDRQGGEGGVEGAADCGGISLEGIRKGLDVISWIVSLRAFRLPPTTL